MQEKNTTTYVSDDGLEFQTKEECLWWEKVAGKVRKLQCAAEIFDLDELDEDDKLPEEIIELLLEDWGGGILDSCLKIQWDYEKYKGEYLKNTIQDASLAPEKVQRLKKFTDWLFGD